MGSSKSRVEASRRPASAPSFVLERLEERILLSTVAGLDPELDSVDAPCDGSVECAAATTESPASDPAPTIDWDATVVDWDAAEGRVPPLVPVAPRASLVWDPTFTASIDAAGERDSFTLDVDADQLITVLVDPAAELRTTFELFDPSGARIGESSGGAPGASAVLQVIEATSAGTYTLTVGGADDTTGAYTAEVILNAAIEDEAHGGASNDTSSAAQDLDASAIALQGSADRLAVLGVSEGGDDHYSFTVPSGDLATVALTALDDRGVAGPEDGALELALFDASGTLVALGASGPENVTRIIEDFIAAAGGRYSARVSGDAGVRYSVVVTRGATLEREPNNELDEAQDLGPTAQVLGEVGQLRSGGGVGPSEPGPSITLGTILFDSTGFRWDIQRNGNINDGSNDAYDGGLVLSGFPSLSTGTTEEDGREIVIGPATVSGVTVTRKIWVPSDQGFARFLEIVSNPGTSAVDFTVRLDSNLGSDGSESGSGGFVATSSSDRAFTTDDDWIITDDRPGSDPTLLHVIGSPGGQRPSLTSFPSGSLSYAWNLSLAAGETRIILHFASQNADQAIALTKAPRLAALELGALTGMSSGELARVVNFRIGDLADFYRFEAAAGDTLQITTTTPGDGPGEPANTLDPRL